MGEPSRSEKRDVAGWEKTITHTGSLPVLGAGAEKGWGLSERLLEVYLYFGSWLLDDFCPGGQECPRALCSQTWVLMADICFQGSSKVTGFMTFPLLRCCCEVRFVPASGFYAWVQLGPP